MAVSSSKDYYLQVFEIVKLIPSGRVTTYGAIANVLGLKSGARMVGYAMNKSHSYSGVPAHRVVNRNGLLTGKMHFSSPTEMEERLKTEGIEVLNDQIQGFKALFWDPSEEI